MKQLSAVLLSLALLVALSAPAFASTCPRLVKQIDQKVAAMHLTGDKAAEVKKLRDEGEAQHKAGKHSESVATLKKALALLEQ